MKLSVITPTFNAMKFLPTVVECLRNQTDKDFEWVVSDGASTDGTLEYLSEIKDLNIKLLSQEDFGIYDALNRGIKACTGDFYLFLGADDVLYPDAVKVYKSAMSHDVDLITASINIDNEISVPLNKRPWLYGQASYISGFSVGVVCNKKLHENNGFFSNKYPIAADQLFIQKSIINGAKIEVLDVVVGRFSTNGLSGIDYLGALTEFHRVQIAIGGNKALQIAIMIIRLLKNFNRL